MATSKGLPPHLAEEWNFPRNETSVENLALGSHKMVWWICSKGHEWEAVVSSRVRGAGCPYCANRKVLQGFNDLATINPEIAQSWHPSKNGDLTPELVVSCSTRRAWWLCSKGHEWETLIYSRTATGTGCPVCSNKKIVIGTNDLATTHPLLAKEWHPSRNEGLTPEDVSGGTPKKAWWFAACGHEWDAAINKRTAGQNCPVCSSRRVLSGYNDLATKNPLLAQEWHPTKNGDKTPDKVLEQSNKEAWWLGPCGHEWKTKISYRRKGGCPICSGRRVLQGYNDIFTTNPETRELWDEDKNGGAPIPNRGSSKQFWWRCPQQHSWKTYVYAVVGAKSGCPVCSGYKCVPGINDLATTHPDLAKEWHPTKNGEVDASTIIAGSEFKAWWKCSAGHEWESRVCTRKWNKSSVLGCRS